MSRVLYGMDADPGAMQTLLPQPYPNFEESRSSNRQSPWSINLPPQYQRQMEAASQYPDMADLRMPNESISDQQMVKIIRHDFENAANYRYQNHDWRWTIADTLYTGWKQPKFWEGTKIPQSALSVMVAFEQIEAMMPAVMETLFGDKEWFEADPIGQTKPESARAVRNILLAQLEPCNPREQLRQVVKSGIMYGNGILDVGWEYLVRTVLQYIPEFIPKQKTIWHPIDNRPIEVPSGEFDRIVREFELEEAVNQPYFAYVPLRRFFIDPNCPGPYINGPRETTGGARFTCIESYMTVDELDALRNTDGFESMPDMYTLGAIAQRKPYYQSDMGTSEQEAARRASYQPWIDQSTDPAAARIKVIHYFTKQRLAWSLNNEFCVFNKPNPLGKFTQHNLFYADLLDRFYAMAISDVVEPEQRAQEGLLNARFNELALAIYPMTVKQRGSGTPVYQTRVRPGAVAESQDPKNDIIRQYPLNATQNSHLETQASQLRVQKATGITDMSMLGVGTPTNPGARTATGAGLQGQAAGRRVLYFSDNAETLVIEPALNDVYQFDRRFLDPKQQFETAQGEQLDPLAIWSGKVRLHMRGASRMRSKQALVQMLPMLFQALLNPALLQQLQATGQTVDLVSVMQMVMDATGYKEKTSWVRQLTPQEMQMMQKPDEAEVKQQLQDSRMIRLREMQLNKQEMDLLKTLFTLKSQQEMKRYEVDNRPAPKAVGSGSSRN